GCTVKLRGKHFSFAHVAQICRRRLVIVATVAEV
ncbi:MAG: hypothetical protein ACI9HX_001523, partial [Pseudoalteromonas tetraodonis]